MKSAINKKRKELLELLTRIDKAALCLERLLIAFTANSPLIADPFSANKNKNKMRFPVLHVFSAAKSIFSAKGALRGKKRAEALAVSDEIKGILEKEGHSLSDLGLNPIGKYKEGATHSYTYPN